MKNEEANNLTTKFDYFFKRSLFFYVIFCATVIIDLFCGTGVVTGIISFFSGIYGVLCTIISSYFGLMVSFKNKNENQNQNYILSINIAVLVIISFFVARGFYKF